MYPKNFLNFFLLVYIFSIQFETWDVLGSNFLISKITFVLYLFSKILFLKQSKIFETVIQFKSYLLLIFSLLFLVIISGYIFSPVDFFSTISFMNFSFFLLILSDFYRDSDNIYKIFNIYKYASLIIIFFLIFGLFTENYVSETRIRVIGQNENDLSLSFSFLIVYSLLNIKNRYRNFYYNIAIMILSFYAILLLGSRSAFVAVVASFFIILSPKKLNLKYFIISFIYFSIAGIAFYFLLMNSNLGARFFTDNFDSGRFQYWAAVYDSSIPIYGIGFNGYRDLVYNQFASLDYFSAHNEFLQWYIYGGFLGLLILSYFFYKVLKLSLKNRITFSFFPIVLVAFLFNQALGIKVVWLIMAFILYHNKFVYAKT
tara:strand:- start:384 stop:1499 length:1116 start_codon:yes stop_codon:yes gene_type:complete